MLIKSAIPIWLAEEWSPITRRLVAYAQRKLIGFNLRGQFHLISADMVDVILLRRKQGASFRSTLHKTTAFHST